MRLFVAIEIDDTIRQEAVRVIETLRPYAPGLKWVNPESLHLTLKFIGEINDTDESNLEPIRAALDTVRLDTVATVVQLKFSRLFWIPNPRRPTIFWMGIQEDDALTSLATQIDRALTPLGVEPEQRPFRPHLTLARFRRDNTGNTAQDARCLVEAAEGMPTADFGQMKTSEFFLIQSQLSPAGAKYTKLRRFDFASSR